MLCFPFPRNGQGSGPDTGRWTEKHEAQIARIGNNHVLTVSDNIFKKYFYFHLCNQVKAVFDISLSLFF